MCCVEIVYLHCFNMTVALTQVLVNGNSKFAVLTVEGVLVSFPGIRAQVHVHPLRMLPLPGPDQRPYSLCPARHKAGGAPALYMSGRNLQAVIQKRRSLLQMFIERIQQPCLYLLSEADRVYLCKCSNQCSRRNKQLFPRAAISAA